MAVDTQIIVTIKANSRPQFHFISLFPTYTRCIVRRRAARLDALIPAKCWDAVEVDRLARAATDAEYREDVLAKKGIVRCCILCPRNSV